MFVLRAHACGQRANRDVPSSASRLSADDLRLETPDDSLDGERTPPGGPGDVAAPRRDGVGDLCGETERPDHTDRRDSAAHEKGMRSCVCWGGGGGGYERNFTRACRCVFAHVRTNKRQSE